MAPSVSSLVKGLAHGVGFFIVGSIAVVVGLIPASYSTLTVGAIITAGLAWIGHYLETV